MNSVLLDTSFLITLANPARPQHALVKYLARTSTTAQAGTRAVLLKNGFDSSWFEGGQYRLAES